jgi:HNH endonuclease
MGNILFKNNQHCKKTTEERFNEKYIVNKLSGCWEWQAHCDKDGYGVFWFNNYPIQAHRFSFIWFIGDIESTMKTCHKCDNPCCVNPFHLFKGTNKDNMNDAQSKGRRPRNDHPSYTHYLANKCRCEECIAAYKKYNVDYYQNKKASKLQISIKE